MRPLSLLFFSAAIAAAFVAGAGCGGKVVIEAGQGGAGQGGSSTTTSTTNVTATTGPTTVTSGVTSGAGGGSVQSNCEIVCGALAQQSCGSQDCLGQCIVASSSEPCGGEAAAWIECAAKNAAEIKDCVLPLACAALEAAFNECDSQPGCGPQSCAADDNGGCACAVECSGTTFEAACEPLGNDKSACTCFIDGNPIDKCMNPSNSCDVSGSCCGDVFFSDSGG